MNKGWLELESDPGLFTLLLEDFGVGGIQVEEIYDLQKAVEGPVYGFIFLFKWIEERRARRKTTQEEETFVTDENIVNSMFFAQQIIPNSCATHALLSVLLNCENVALGDTLTQFKEFTQHMGTEDKGFAIGNMPDLARAHNRHARPEPYQLPEKQQGMAAVRTAEAFHFVSYVPVNGRLFELDGLKPHPIDHGPWGEQEDWTEKFRRVITERLGMATDGGEPYHDIRFNLMAVVPDRRQHYEQKLKTLKTNRQIILETLQQMVKVTSDTVESPRSRSSTGSSSGQSVLPPGAKGKAEPIITRSVAAKEAASDGGGTKLRSTRLREKAAAAAQALSAAPGYDPRSPPELDSHNYAKSPDMQDYPQLGQQGVEAGAVMDDLDDDEDAEELAHRQTSQETIDKFERQSVRHADVKIQITVEEPGGEGAAGAGGGGGTVTHATTVASTDITKPLIIQTKFGNLPPGPGTGSSTDTASEVGSCLSSPVCSTGTGTCQPSPTVWTPNHRGGGSNSTHTSPATASSTPGADTKPDISDPAIMAAAAAQNLHSKMEEEGGEGEGGGGGGEKSTSPPREKSSPSSSTSSGERRSSRRGFGSHAFTPKDLLQLLKNVESEISACESNLRDEVDKHNKYKMDQCRRTHNYDQFICTFLSMLAEQGHIASLVEPNLMGKRRASISSSSLKASSKKPDKRKKTAKTKKRK